GRHDAVLAAQTAVPERRLEELASPCRGGFQQRSRKDPRRTRRPHDAGELPARPGAFPSGTDRRRRGNRSPAGRKRDPPGGKRDPARENCYPLEGSAIPPAGNAIPREGIACPLEGIAYPLEGIVIPLEGKAIPLESRHPAGCASVI